MKKFLLFLSFLLLIGFELSFAQERKWQTFNSPDGNWSILSPGALQPDDDARKSPSKQGTFSLQDTGFFYAVAFRDFSRTPKNLKKYFDKTRDGAVKGFDGRLMKERDFTLGNSAGREFYIKKDNRVQRTRIFFHGKRLYVIIAVLDETAIESAEINAYMNSFTVKNSKT